MGEGENREGGLGEGGHGVKGRGGVGGGGDMRGQKGTPGPENCGRKGTSCRCGKKSRRKAACKQLAAGMRSNALCGR